MSLLLHNSSSLRPSLPRGLALVAALACGACAQGAPSVGDLPGAGGDPSASDVGHRLDVPAALAVADQAGGSNAALQAVSLQDGQTAEVQLAVTDGALTLSRSRDGALLVDDLVVDVGDVEVSPAVVPPSGLRITGISLSLAGPATIDIDDQTADHVSGTASLAVNLQWSVMLDRGVVDLAPIHLAALPVDLDIDLSGDGALSAQLRASQDGSFWNWAGVFELRDLSLDIAAFGDAPRS